jgi:hypothetical protein
MRYIGLTLYLAFTLLFPSEVKAQTSGAQPPAATPSTPSISSGKSAGQVYGRAVDVAVWGMPIVSFDALRQAYFRDAKASTTTSSGGQKDRAGKTSR